MQRNDSSVSVCLMMQAQYHPYVYTEHKRII